MGLMILPYLAGAQPKIKSKKYPSLLWEITGNGLNKPSYLFGTMHVSSKLAFHLADSFFLGIRNADVVALETNPESWQEDMSRYDLGNSGSRTYNGYTMAEYTELPGEYLYSNTLKFYKYDKKIERALYSNPSAINNLLYRSYGNETSDFEEDTYLDMYIYQCGKKWGKKVAGVERYAESMKLMMEAYKDAAKDRKVKERSYDNENSYSFNKLQEAYRSGNLDWLDSINKYNSFSPSFDEKFLYRRNEIQASSIDSILRSGQSLFVGVGAAHLPGNRGVIEMLRQQGYRLRPIKMGARDSRHKSQVEKVRVAVTFSTQAADDGLYKVDIPGKFYKFGEDASLDQQQYADMANGSYYMVTRIQTNGWMWGHNTDNVYRVVDSLLYENIPGRIVSKSKIIRNGYTGIDLVNKTRRGDIQRYHIFIMPFEVVIFKMSGTGDYVSNGDEARRFFGSIKLREYKAAQGWRKFSPAYGGFAVDMPHTPHVSNDGSWIYDAADESTKTHFRVIRTDVHNYHFASEDTFDLELMAESFASSEFIDRQVSRKLIKYAGYPALDCEYRAKNGALFLTRFVIQGPHYYSLVAYAKSLNPSMQKFLNSFEIKDLQYNAASLRKDTSLYYTVSSPVFPENKREKLDMPKFNYTDDDDDAGEESALENGAFRSKVITSDSTGEKIYVSFFKMQRYYYVKDSAKLEQLSQARFGDSSGIVRFHKNLVLPGGFKVWETILSDTGSSRIIWSKTFYRDGIGYTMVTQADTLSQPGSFVKSFFDSFTPVDTIKGINPFTKKAGLFFEDFMSSDSIAHKRAVKNIYTVRLDSSYLPHLKNAITSLDWNEKKYLDIKKDLVGKMESMDAHGASDYLRDLYYAAGDTVELQYKVLETLLRQKTAYAYDQFLTIMENDPPVLESGQNNTDNSLFSYDSDIKSYNRKFNVADGNFMNVLHDSLALTARILPGLLPLINIDDYKRSMMELMTELADSQLVDKKDYELYFSKFLFEAKQEMKKQSIAEKRKAIAIAEKIKLDKKSEGDFARDNETEGTNEKLRQYMALLLPYRDASPAVRNLFDQVFKSNDKRLKYNSLVMMMRNKKPYADSLLSFFASQDEFRYSLYKDLSAIGMDAKFPNRYKNHVDLGRSKLLGFSYYEKPDSLVYIERREAVVKNRKGFIYFFKYKLKKDDAGWKLATVGLVPPEPNAIEFPIQEADETSVAYRGYRDSGAGLTGFRDTRLNDEEPLAGQLEKELKRLLYSQRKSAKHFYDKPEGSYSNISINFDED